MVQNVNLGTWFCGKSCGKVDCLKSLVYRVIFKIRGKSIRELCWGIIWVLVCENKGENIG